MPKLPEFLIQPFCFRCYELRCVNNIVPGNYSTDDVAGPVPYRIAPGQLKPVYDVDTINGAPPEDDYRRVFPGNVLNATDQLFTQCWNSTDAQVWLLPAFATRTQQRSF